MIYPMVDVILDPEFSTGPRNNLHVELSKLLGELVVQKQIMMYIEIL